MKTRNLWRSRPRVEELEGRWVPSAVPGTSTNWSGYAVTASNGAVSQVSGSWVVPAVQPTVSGYSSAWVGIDGAGSSRTVEQIGTDSDYVNGLVQYYAWYEMYPAAPVNLSLTVQPGDTISASVTYVGSGGFALSLTDLTTPGTFSITKTASSAKRSSAEWIQEAPSSFFGVLPLADFGTIDFSAARATVNGTPGPADTAWSNSTLYQVNMVTSSGALKASTSALTDSGSSFRVMWISSGSGERHGKHAPDVQPDASVTSQASLSLAATARALVQAGITPPTPAPSATVLVAPSSAVVVPVVPSLFSQPPVTLADRSPDASDSGPAVATGRPAVPELLPPPSEIGTPGNGAAPAVPDSVQPPPADRVPPGQPGTSLDPGRMGDAVFLDGRWEPAAPVEAAPAAAGGTGDDATSVESAGLALALALGGTWGIAMQETAARRRRPRLI